MKRFILAASVAVVALLLPLRAAAQPAHADSPKATLIVANELVVGTATLLPGEYKIQCKTIEGKTFLVVVFTETGREVARVACVREAFDGKVPDTTYGTTPDPAGKRTLTWVRIKGETSQHKVVAP
jgi:hypothetical protein